MGVVLMNEVVKRGGSIDELESDFECLPWPPPWSIHSYS